MRFFSLSKVNDTLSKVFDVNQTKEEQLNTFEAFYLLFFVI